MTLDELREAIAAQEGVGEFSAWVCGGNEAQLRESAIALRRRFDGRTDHPTPDSAMAAMLADRQRRNARMRFR